jgi:hypothetical protein
VALSSFVPEIMAPRGLGAQDAGQQGRDAIRFLIQLARVLKRASPGKRHDVRVIEVVSGSRIDGVWLGRETGRRLRWPARPGCFANRMGDPESRTRLLNALEEIVGDGDVGLRPSEGISLAIELEPGQQYCLKSWLTLVDLGEALDHRPRLSPVLGFCLDIAHWNVAGVKPKDLEDSASVKSRIVHAHISGHHRCGHLGDVPFSQRKRLEDYEDYLEWLQLLSGLSRKGRPGRPPFSGFISLELEAAKHIDYVLESWKQLRDRTVS